MESQTPLIAKSVSAGIDMVRASRLCHLLLSTSVHGCTLRELILQNSAVFHSNPCCEYRDCLVLTIPHFNSEIFKIPEYLHSYQGIKVHVHVLWIGVQLVNRLF